MLIALKLAKAGYYGGDPHNVFNANVEHVLTTWDYEIFLADYEAVTTELNKES